MFRAEKSITRTHLTDFMLPVCLFLGCNPDYVAGLDVCLGSFLVGVPTDMYRKEQKRMIQVYLNQVHLV